MMTAQLRTEQTYTSRDPKTSALYRIVAEHFEALKRCYSERFEETYGPWKKQWDIVVERFLRCGDLHYGFARVYCFGCRHTFLRPLTCKARNFCPSCEAKRRALWVEHVVQNVLPGNIPFRMIVFTMPKSLRRIFMRERVLLGDFARVAYTCTRLFFQEQFPQADGVPYFITSLHNAGDHIHIHPHLHCICSCGIKSKDGVFHPAPEEIDFSPLEEMFRHGILNMLCEKGRLTEQTRKRFLAWRNSGFSADASTVVGKDDREGLERVTAYVLRPPVSLKRLTYQSGASTVLYRGRYNPSTKSNFTVLDPKEFLVLLLSHVPPKNECLIRYFGAAASTERRLGGDPQVPLLEEESTYVKKRRNSWARLIHKIYGVDPLKCPKCGSEMKVIAFIKDEEVIEKILRHLEVWDPPRGPPFEPQVKETVYDYNVFDDIHPVEMQSRM